MGKNDVTNAAPRPSAREARYLSGRTVWVTGATSGIGKALAIRIAPLCRRLIISARRTEELHQLERELSPATVTVLPLDLASGQSIQRAVDAALGTGTIDLLINCAGVSQRGSFAETSLDVFRRVVEVNLMGTAALTHAVLSDMLKHGGGHIVAVTSLAGLVGAPDRGGYCAAKHALHGLYDSIRTEVMGTGVRLTLVVPGFVHTEISDNALLADGSRHGATDRLQAAGMSAERCAAKSLRAIARGRREYWVAMGVKGLLMIWLRRLSPGILWRLLQLVNEH